VDTADLEFRGSYRYRLYPSMPSAPLVQWNRPCYLANRSNHAACHVSHRSLGRSLQAFRAPPTLSLIQWLMKKTTVPHPMPPQTWETDKIMDQRLKILQPLREKIDGFSACPIYRRIPVKRFQARQYTFLWWVLITL
jgi:hypothetical protein